MVVFDAVPGIDKQIKSGLVDIAIAQRPDEIGYYGVKFAADVIYGKKIPTPRARVSRFSIKPISTSPTCSNTSIRTS
ncbi:MAG: hypothetical protein CBARDCOR_2083 [uncultured Caballeronia sp.]|nr:MAG: hypothetical protein CBARDCOR_2083 [uncultured Caballeronia sp.]